VVTAPLLPGPKGNFLSGNLPEFSHDPLGFLTMSARKYGSIVRLRFGKPILLNELTILDVLVTNHHNFIKAKPLRANRCLLGNGLLTSEGDFWLRQRRWSSRSSTETGSLLTVRS